MELFFVKLTLTPLLMVAVSLVARRWGGALGGLLAGLPLTAAPISVYLTIEQGRAFAANAAVASIGGIAAVVSSYLVYAEASRRFPLFWTTSAAILGYAAVSLGLRALAPPLAALLVVNALLILLVFRRNPVQPGASVPPVTAATWDLPSRILVSTAMVLLVTLSAAAIGPSYSGLLSTVPMIGWPLLVFAHRQQGRGEAVRVMVGILRGVFGLIAFYLVVFAMFPARTPSITFAVALAASLGLTAGLVFGRRAGRLFSS